MKSTVLHLLYNLLMILALPGVLLRLLWRSRKNPGYAQRIHERFGEYKKPYQQGGIVIHAVSVGETVAAQPLIERFLTAYPDLPITVTSTTPTGSARVLQLFGKRVQHVYLPYDYPFAIRRFLKTFKPSRMVIMETEWWPNLLLETSHAGVTLCMANARLSERSLKGYQRISALSSRMAQCLNKICTQTQNDAENFIKLGVPAESVEVTGNIKFDVHVEPHVYERAAAFKATLKGRPVWIAASTHAGEEQIVIHTVQRILKVRPDALALIVPRHPERFSSFYESLRHSGLTVARRSHDEIVTSETQVYFGDTMGDLLMLYGAADVAFVAGSFVPAGGHNMLEAAMMDCAIVMGPHLENIASQAQQLVKAKGMLVINSPDDLAQAVLDWFESPQDRHESITHAKQFLIANQGAVNRTFNTLEGAFK